VSLSGSVEDLPLLEILQVVSFCRKSGHLVVQSPGVEAGVVFDTGRVVAGYASDLSPLPAGVPPPGPEREKLLRTRVTTILERLVRQRDGRFAFHLTEEVPTGVGARNLSDEMLPGGINPEELMLELAKTLDEDRRDAAAVLEASFAAPEADEPLEELELEELPEERPATGPRVLLVDDEPDVRRVVSERLSAAGFEVHAVDDPHAARAEMERLAGEGRPLLLVADIGLPGQSETGASFRGGLELAHYARGIAPAPPVLLMAETIDEKLRTRARRAGAQLLAWKPGLSKLDPMQYEADLRAFGDKLARDLLPRLEGRRVAGEAQAARKRAARPLPLTPVVLPVDEARRAREAALDAASFELARQPDPDVVAFLLLRAARAFFPRVVLFSVRDERLRGLGGVGPVADGQSLDFLARELSVPLDADSPFSDAVALGRTWSGPLPRRGPVHDMVERLGRLGASSAAVLPVRAQHTTIAVVYGDVPGGGPLPELEPLFAFAERAGRALDMALLERRSQQQLAC
jgi:CheY-like chemotaxis protein